MNIEEFASCTAEVWFDPAASWTERVFRAGGDDVHNRRDQAAPNVKVASIISNEK